MKVQLTEPQFQDADKAREHLEAMLWPDGPVCPHCGTEDKAHYKLQGKAHRKGLYKCRVGTCRKQFTVTTGTVFHSSHIPLNVWLAASYLMACSKKGISALQLQRMLGIGSYRTAWFMAHRLRESARRLAPTGKAGENGGTVEADETYWGNQRRKVKSGVKGGYEHKMKIFSLVERGGDVRSFHVRHVDGKTLKPIIREHVDRSARMMTDEHGAYKDLDKEFASHDQIRHSRKEYVRGQVYTNTIEGYFSLLKRGLVGTFHHVSEEHLFRYISEFDFRYNHRDVSDAERSDALLSGIVGKRLTYHTVAA